MTNHVRYQTGCRRAQWTMAGLLLLLLFAAGVPSLTAGELTSESLPKFEMATRFRAQGGTFSILGESMNKESDPCRMIVSNQSLGKSVTFDSGIWLSPAVLFDHGRKFLTVTVDEIEGPATYTAYDLDRTALGSLTTRHDIRPSETGAFYYTINKFMAPAVPIVYGPDFSVLKEFDAKKEVRGYWNATILGDSLYVLGDYNGIRLFKLPTFDLVGEFPITLPDGAPLYRLYTNESGSRCAVTNIRNVAVINTVTGSTQTFATDFAEKVHLSNDGTRMYILHGQNDLLDIQEYAQSDDAFVFSKSQSVTLSDFVTPPVKILLDDVMETGKGLAVNLTVMQGDTRETFRTSTGTAMLSPGSSASQAGAVSFVPGLTWIDRTGASPAIRHLTPVADHSARLSEISATGEEITK